MDSILPFLHHMKETAGEYRQRLVLTAQSPQLRSQSLLIGIAAYLVGLLLASFIIPQMSFPTGTLERAKELGIYGPAILDGYPKDRDVWGYATSLVIITATVATLWVLWALRAAADALVQEVSTSSRGSKQPEKTAPAAWPHRVFDWIILPLGLGWLLFDPGFLRGLPWPGSFIFLSEQGQHLAMAHTILRGDVLYRDVFVQYGPLMEYPLGWLMHLLGPSITTFRVYLLLVNFLGFLIIYLFLRAVLHSRFLVLLGVLFFLGFYFSQYPATNGGISRVALGFAPLAATCVALDRRKTLWAILPGMASAFALFYSQEVGLSATLAALGMISVHSLTTGDWGMSLVRKVGFFTLGMSAVIGPFVIYFAAVDGLGAFFEGYLGYPMIASMGYLAKPFPSLFHDIAAVVADLSLDLAKIAMTTALLYLPIAFYGAVASHLLVRLLTRQWSRRDTQVLGTLILAVLLFRGAIASPGLGRVFFFLPPAFVLCCLYVEGLLRAIREDTVVQRGVHALKSPLLLHVFLVFLIIGSVALYGAHGLAGRRAIIGFVQMNVDKILPGDQSAQDHVLVPLAIERGEDIYLPSNEALRLREVVSYVQANTSPDDYIVAFPYEPLYYFLIDRPVGLPFLYSDMAATKPLREKAVQVMEARRPKYVIYSLDTPRPSASEDIMVPEITLYIQEHYRLEAEFLGTHVLVRQTAEGYEEAR